VRACARACIHTCGYVFKMPMLIDLLVMCTAAGVGIWQEVIQYDWFRLIHSSGWKECRDRLSQWGPEKYIYKMKKTSCDDDHWETQGSEVTPPGYGMWQTSQNDMMWAQTLVSQRRDKKPSC